MVYMYERTDERELYKKAREIRVPFSTDSAQSTANMKVGERGRLIVRVRGFDRFISFVMNLVGGGCVYEAKKQEISLVTCYLSKKIDPSTIT